jgi:hydroxyacylglutathione hydrolase
MNLIPLKLSLTNCFLVKAGVQYILVDTGDKADWELFCKRLQEAGVGLAQISHIILTHHDFDHSGLLNRIINENSKIRVVMSHFAKALLEKGESDLTRGKRLINKRIKLLWPLQLSRLTIMLSTGKYIDQKSNGKFPPYYARPVDQLITSETRLKDLGISLEGRIIETPGHTIDSITILFDDGDALVGDAAANLLQLAGTKNCVVMLEDFDEYYRSWQKIIAGNARRIFPAHGNPFSVEKLRKNLGKNAKSKYDDGLLINY